jgi:two-component system, chemotaxis family, chemotaxis protein CheY
MAYNLKAMVVDDDEHVRTFLVVLVRKLVSGTVFEARNGLEAIEVYQQEKPELILLDVNMPLLDGMASLERLKEINPDVVVIMITSLAMRRIVEEAVQGGAAHFIRKDTSKAQMMQIIKETVCHAFFPEQLAALEAEFAQNT